MDIFRKIIRLFDLDDSNGTGETFEDIKRYTKQKHKRERKEWKRNFRNEQKRKEENERITYKMKKLERNIT